MSVLLNANRDQPALMHGAALEWKPSPQPGVQRRMLERIGDEVALASSIVRYQPGSRFPVHSHELGEEFVVLEGIFSDEFGDYPEGTYVRNPPKSSHAPFSKQGCVIFVKLRQMASNEDQQITLQPSMLQWRQESELHLVADLHSNHSTFVCFTRLQPGYRATWSSSPQGEEIFVVDGTLRLQGAMSGTLERWSWLRHRSWAPMQAQSDDGALLWIKRGHLDR